MKLKLIALFIAIEFTTQ